jgi:hypothetical protein
MPLFIFQCPEASNPLDAPKFIVQQVDWSFSFKRFFGESFITIKKNICINEGFEKERRW